MPQLRLGRDGLEATLALGKDLLAKIDPCGFIIFGGKAQDVKALTSELTSLAGRILLFGADLERGAGWQFEGLREIQTSMAIAACPERSRLAEEAGAQTAREALSVGVNLLFMPCCDVNTEPANPIINVRAFSDDHEVVSSLVMDWIGGAQGEGALACAKHFPGHGSTKGDSHLKLAVGPRDPAEFKKRHLPPFYAAMAAGVASIMTAHITVPARGIDSTAATLSDQIVNELLRTAGGFQGLVITDALLMAGLGVDEKIGAEKALKAGCDILLCPEDPVGVHEYLKTRIIDIDPSLDRLERTALRIKNEGREVSLEGPGVAAEIAANSLVADGKPGDLARFTIMGGDSGRFDSTPLRDELISQGMEYIEELPSDVEGSGLLVAVFSHPTAWRGEGAPADEYERLIPEGSSVVSFGDPYFLLRRDDCPFRLWAWDGHPLSQMEAARVIRGEEETKGKMPVARTGHSSE